VALTHNVACHLISSILALFGKNAMAKDVTIKWRVLIGSRSGSSMIFCHHKMAQDGKEMRSKTYPSEMVFVKRPRQVMVAEATSESAWQRGTFLGRRSFLFDK
jgi:hypothetical protein